MHLIFDDFGAIGDGVTDDTEAVQAAFDAAKPGDTLGGSGTYRVTRTIRVEDAEKYQ